MDAERQIRTAKFRNRKLLWWDVKDHWDPSREDFGLPGLLGHSLKARSILRHLGDTHFTYEPKIPDKPYADVVVGIDPWSLALCVGELSNHTGCYEKVLYWDGGELTGDQINAEPPLRRNRALIVTTVLHGAATWLPSLAEALKKEGAVLVGIWCIVDNETGGRELAQKLYGLKVSSLFRRSELERDDLPEESHVA